MLIMVFTPLGVAIFFAQCTRSMPLTSVVGAGQLLEPYINDVKLAVSLSLALNPGPEDSDGNGAASGGSVEQVKPQTETLKPAVVQ